MRRAWHRASGAHHALRVLLRACHPPRAARQYAVYNRVMDLEAALQQLANDPAAPLDPAEVALHLAQDEYPHLDVEGYLSELDCMAHELKAYLRGDLDVQVHGLCRYLFHEMGFHGNTQEYYDPKNSYLNDVLD